MRSRRWWLMLALAVLVALWWSRTEAPSLGSVDTTSKGANVIRSDEGSEPHAAERTPTAPEAGADPEHRVAQTQVSTDAATAPGVANDEALAKLDRQVTTSAWLERNAELAEQTVEHFCAQSKRAAREPLFEPSGAGRDATALLLPLIDWEGGVDRMPIRGRLHLPEPLAQRIRSLSPDTWPSALAVDSRDLDFGWMQDALAYDHWNLAEDPRFADQPERWFDATIPNFVPLQQWAKLRLAQGLDRGDAAQGAAEVRHLATLCDSTGLLVGTMIGVSLRGLERVARSEALRRGLDMTDWPMLSDEARLTYRSASFNAMYYFYPGVKRSVMARAASCAVAPCVAFAEGLGMHHTLGSFVATDSTRDLEAIIDEHHCHSSPLERARRAAAISDPDPAMFGDTRLAEYLDGGAH